MVDKEMVTRALRLFQEELNATSQRLGEVMDSLCDDCGHFHREGACADPGQKCGDYRCCQP